MDSCLSGLHDADPKQDALLDDVVDVLEYLYVSETGRFVMMSQGRKPYVAKDTNGNLPLTPWQIRRHVQREFSMAVFASVHGSKFVCFDVDDGDPQTVGKVLSSLERFGIDREYAHVSFSGKKGYHIDVFFDELIEIDKLKALYRWAIADAGLDARKVEFRPSDKQAIKLPLSLHQETGKMCWFVDSDSLLPIESYDPLFEIRQWPAEDLYARIWQYAMSLTGEEVLCATEKDGRVRENIMALGLAAPLRGRGMRHGVMVKMAVRCRYVGLERDETHDALLDWYVHQDKKLIHSSEHEVRRDIAAIVSWVYQSKFEQAEAHSLPTVTLTRKDMDWILRQPSANRRKLLFLLMVHERANCNRISADRLAKMIRTDKSTVRRALFALKRENCILVQEGHKKKTANGYYQHPNAYFTVRDEQGYHGRPQIQAVINIKDLGEHIDEVYYGLIDKLYRPTELIGLMGKRETAEYLTWLENHRKDDEHG